MPRMEGNNHRRREQPAFESLNSRGAKTQLFVAPLFCQIVGSNRHLVRTDLNKKALDLETEKLHAAVSSVSAHYREELCFVIKYRVSQPCQLCGSDIIWIAGSKRPICRWLLRSELRSGRPPRKRRVPTIRLPSPIPSSV